MRAIDDRGNAPDWTPGPFCQKRRYHTMAAMKCGIRRKKLRYAARKRGHEGGIRFVDRLRRSFKPLPL
jgi:hypothetical protein